MNRAWRGLKGTSAFNLDLSETSFLILPAYPPTVHNHTVAGKKHLLMRFARNRFI